MVKLIMEMPEAVFAATREDPGHFAMEMRLTAAAAWYSQGRISQEMAAKMAGMDRTDFLLALAKLGVDSFKVDMAELDKEISCA